jgi:flagellar hook-associated protein 3 FlgL
MLDHVIKGGTIVDGTGTPGVRGDIGVRDGRIVQVGGTITDAAANTIDADGANVTPGWVDVHTHYDGQVSWDDEMDPSAGNGVTNLTPMARQAIAAELRSVRGDLLNAGNATFAGRSLFAGTAAGPAYDSTGAYLGNDDAVVRDVTVTTSMTVNVTGSEVFGVSGTGAGSLFDVLDRMATAISNGDSTTIATEHTNLEAATDRVRTAAASIGTKSAALVDLRSRIEDDIASLTSRLSEVEDVDIVESLVRAKAEETSYQAAVQAAARVIPVSLLDYLR